MTKYKVYPTEPALADVDEAFLWIYDQAPDAAIEWYEGIIEAFELLSRLPLRCPLAHESVLFNEGIRHLLYGRYRILYTVEGKTVYILRVRHHARDHLKPETD